MTVTVCTQPVAGCTAANEATTMLPTPAQIIASAGGYVEYLTGLAWADWGTAQATATGTLVTNKCLILCAPGGPTSSYPATVTLSGLSAYASGTSAYGQMRIASPTSPIALLTFVTKLIP